jgi:hypothetical protein
MKFKTREEWLTAALTEIAPFFDGVGAGVPAKLRAACGYPLHFSRNGKIVDFTKADKSADGTWEVLIAPTVAETHEVFKHMWHVCEEMAVFGAPMPDLTDIIDSLGPYPHAEVLAVTRKKQSTRMHKAECPACGMIIRMTAKWTATMPVCSADGSTFVLEGTTPEEVEEF